MKAKKVFALILILISLFSMVFCSAIKGVAASKSSSKGSNKKEKIVSRLKKEDFYFSDANGNIVEYEGANNYIDWYARGGANSIFGYQFSACTNPLDNNGKEYSMVVPGGYETGIYLTLRPGVNFGSSESEIQAVYGKVPIWKYNSKNGPKIDLSYYNHTYDHSNVPSECCIYSYYKTGRVYIQVMDFNDEKQLCRVIWDCYASDGYTVTGNSILN